MVIKFRPTASHDHTQDCCLFFTRHVSNFLYKVMRLKQHGGHTGQRSSDILQTSSAVTLS